jgi:ornithine carbamoyltransferase
MTPAPAPRHLLTLADLAEELPEVLRTARALKESRKEGLLPARLAGVNIGLIFEKPSTRTRTSFEVGINDLGGHAVYLSPKDMQLGRGETIADTARVLSRYLDALVYRAFRHTDMLELAKWSSIPVVNALDDLEHPCQIVADLLTLSERWGGQFKGKRLAYIGDGNNVLHSLLIGCAAVGLDLTAATPAAYAPKPEVLKVAEGIARRTGAKLTVVRAPSEAAQDADALYTDVWVSMGDEAEQGAREAAFQGYQINAALVAKARKDVWVLHDLPAHRGLEITDEVIDGPRSVVFDQAENRLHAQKAILLKLLPLPGPRTT